jgi:hypothetical protein
LKDQHTFWSFQITYLTSTVIIFVNCVLN